MSRNWWEPDLTPVPSVALVEQRLIDLGVKRHRIAAILAAEADIDQTTWRRWRNGEVEPTLGPWIRVVGAVIKLEKREKRNGKKQKRMVRRGKQKAGGVGG